MATKVKFGNRYGYLHPSGDGDRLLIGLHGMWLDSAAAMPYYSGLTKLAARLEASALFLQASGGFGFGPFVLGSQWETRCGLDNRDMVFLGDVLSTFRECYKIWLVGMSNGAGLVDVALQMASTRVSGACLHSPQPVTHESATFKQVPMVVCVGQNDPLGPAAAVTATRYREWGHDVHFVEQPNKGHFYWWPKDELDLMYETFSQ